MTATVARLRHLHLAKLEGAAHSWRRQAQRLAEGETAVASDVTRPLKDFGWSGQAADSAIHEIDWLGDRMHTVSSTARLIAHALETATARWRSLQDRLHQLFEDATRHGLLLDDDGVRLPAADPRLMQFEEYQARRHRLETAASLLRRRVRELLDAADRLDAEFALALRKLQPASPGEDGNVPAERRDLIVNAQAVAALAGYPRSRLPDHGVDPGDVAGWWGTVAPGDRAVLLQAFAQHLGALDGMPAADRDVANRTHLDHCLIGAGGRDTRAASELRDLLRQADAERPGRVLLLCFDNTGHGQAAVAIGNPDRAAHTAVFVPGVGTELSGMPGLIERADRLQHAADLMTPALGDVSVVAWLGYDAPEHDVSATRWDRSREGGLALDSFVNGLNAAHEPSPTHVTAIGHSYGSTVVGDAARDDEGLAVGDIVVAGSPGMHVGDVWQLNLHPHHVWAGHADGDPISGAVGRLSGAHDREPHLPAFGANRFATDTSGHGGYWDGRSLSLHNQAAIVVGRYEQVQLIHGAVPR